MTTYNTGNPVPSADARDRYDNSQTFDEVINGTLTFYRSRVGSNIMSLAGMQSLFNASQIARSASFNAAQDQRKNAFQDFIEGSGWVSLGAYAAGISITSHSQTVDYQGQPYQLKPSVPASIEAPYVTTGNWATEGVKFKLVGDNSLRQDLSATTGAKEIGTKNGKLDVVLDEMLFDTRGSRPSLTSVMGVDDRYLPIAKLVRATGDATYNALYGVKREIQSFAPDEVNRKYYSLHNNNDPVALKSIVTRYVMDSEGVAKAQDAVATPGNEFGHQGIAVENLPGNAVKIWCTDGLNPLGVIRFDFANGQPALNKEHYVLFSAADGFNAGISSFQGFSVDNQYVIGSAKVVGSNVIKCRLWLLSDLLDGGPGDYSASYKYEIDVSSLYDADHPIQGLACDNSSVYGVSGGNTLTAPARWMAKWDIATGALLETNHNVMIGSIEAALDGSGISYEPEGLNFVVAGGAPKLCVGIRSGSSLTPSVFRVHAINLKPVDRINARVSGKVLSIQRADEEIGSMEVNTSAMMMMAAPGRQLRLGANGEYHIEIDTVGNIRSFLDGVPSVGTQARRFNQGWFNQIRFGTGLAIRFGTGSPEGVVSEGPATIYMDFGNGDLYCKKSGTGNKNWKLITMAG